LLRSTHLLRPSDSLSSPSPPTTELYTLSLHDALPIFGTVNPTDRFQIQDVLFELYAFNLSPLQTGVFSYAADVNGETVPMELVRSEEHTSELQSRENLVCRLLLEKKKQHH